MVSLFLFSKVQEPQTPQQKTSMIAALSANFPDAWRDVGNGNFIVATSKTLITQDVANLVGITSGNAGAYIVTNLEPYYGWANKTIWEWIKAMKDRDV